MDPVELSFSVLPEHPRELDEPWVGIGDFESKHSGAVVYTEEAGASLTSKLWVDLITGRPLPTRLVIREVRTVEHLLCLSIFMDREFCLSPKVPALINAVELAKALQEAGLAHVDPDMARLLKFLDTYMFRRKLNRKELGEHLKNCAVWLRAYALEDKLPSLPRVSEPPKILDKGTNGFALAESDDPKNFSENVIEIYRQGFLRGLLFGPEKEGLTPVLAFKKSNYLQFDLDSAASQLNQAEKKVGQPTNWTVMGLYLRNPGTRMPRDLVTEIMLRV